MHGKQWRPLKEDLHLYLEEAGVEGEIVMDGVAESVELTPEEMTVENLDQFLVLQDGQFVRNVVLGADANDHEYLMVDFYTEKHYLGRGLIVDNKLIEYQKLYQGWQEVEVKHD